MPNIKNIINKHNSKLLSPQPTNEEINPGYNCKNRNIPCPLGGEWVLYKATIKENNNTTNTYIGVSKRTFNKRYYSHTSSFRKTPSHYLNLFRILKLTGKTFI